MAGLDHVALGDVDLGDGARDLGEDRARVDVDAALVPRLTGDPLLLATLVNAVGQAGFVSAAVDPRGFRSGSMNDVLRADGDS